MSAVPPVSRDIGVLRAGWQYASITDKIAGEVLVRPVRWPWLVAFLVTFAGTLAFVASMGYLFLEVRRRHGGPVPRAAAP